MKHQNGILLLALILACAGCASAAPSGVEPAAQTAPEPVRGGVFHLPVAGTNANLNPYNTGGSVTTLGDTIYERLVGRDVRPGVNWAGDPKLVPWLAQRWERTDDTSYLFELRTDVKWHDGERFSADDVVHSFNHLRDAPGLLDTARVGQVRSVEALDSTRVRITTTKPNPEFLKDDILNVEITPRHLAAQGRQLETSAVGTGPFQLRQFDKTAGWTVVRNEGYWIKGLPYLDGIAGHYMSDRGTMVAAMVAGNIDAMVVNDKPQLDVILGLIPDVRYERGYGERGYGVGLAIDRPPFDDVRVRQAINLAVDRHEMVVKGAFGDAVINPPLAAGWVGSAIPQEELLRLPGYNPATRQQDVAQAKQLLAEAGVRNLAAKLSFAADNTSTRPIAEVVSAQLKENLGMDITLQPLDRTSAAKMEQEGSYEMRIGSNTRGRSGLVEQLHSKGALNKRGPFDPQLDALLDRYIAEFDDAQVARLHQQIQRLLHDRAYFIGGMDAAFYAIYQPWFHDMLYNYGGNVVPYYTPPALWIDVEMLPANRRGEKP